MLGVTRRDECVYNNNPFCKKALTKKKITRSADSIQRATKVYIIALQQPAVSVCRPRYYTQ